MTSVLWSKKNNTLVRAYLGYDRFDTVTHTHWINLLYDKMWLYYNFFQPVIRLVEKQVIAEKDGRSRVLRRYDIPRTPFDRLIHAGILSADDQLKCENLRKRTNPRQLRSEIYQMLEHIFALPLAIEGKTEDIFETLRTKHGE